MSIIKVSTQKLDYFSGDYELRQLLEASPHTSSWLCPGKLGANIPAGLEALSSVQEWAGDIDPVMGSDRERVVRSEKVLDAMTSDRKADPRLKDSAAMLTEFARKLRDFGFSQQATRTLLDRGVVHKEHAPDRE